MTPFYAFLARSFVTVAAPVLSSLNVAQTDSAGGDTFLIATGTTLATLTGVQFSRDGGTTWVAGSLGTLTSTSAQLIPPAMAASTNGRVRVTGPGGTSGTLTVEFWAPTDDPTVTFICDAKSNPYNATTGIWTPRYTAVAGIWMVNAPGSSNNVPSDGAGGMLLNGNGALGEIGLNNNSGFFSSFLGAAITSQQPGSYAAVFSSQTPTTMALSGYAATPYNGPSMVANAPQGTTGVECFVATDDGLHRIAAHVYDGVNGGYHVVNVQVAAGAALRSVVARWSADGSNLFDLSVDGALSGAGYSAFAGLTAATSNAYTSTTFNAGTRYPGSNPTNQLAKGVMKCFAILSGPASNAFVTKFAQWKTARFGT